MKYQGKVKESVNSLADILVTMAGINSQQVSEREPWPMSIAKYRNWFCKHACTGALKFGIFQYPVDFFLIGGLSSNFSNLERSFPSRDISSS